ncbi:MAG: hypothetical protein JW769_02775 [Parachlamydiales bacterium]|nr:hypothetical protein [Parachlamydiales bacterium]
MTFVKISSTMYQQLENTVAAGQNSSHIKAVFTMPIRYSGQTLRAIANIAFEVLQIPFLDLNRKLFSWNDFSFQKHLYKRVIHITANVVIVALSALGMIPMAYRALEKIVDQCKPKIKTGGEFVSGFQIANRTRSPGINAILYQPPLGKRDPHAECSWDTLRQETNTGVGRTWVKHHGQKGPTCAWYVLKRHLQYPVGKNPQDEKTKKLREFQQRFSQMIKALSKQKSFVKWISSPLIQERLKQVSHESLQEFKEQGLEQFFLETSLKGQEGEFVFHNSSTDQSSFAYIRDSFFAFMDAFENSVQSENLHDFLEQEYTNTLKQKEKEIYQQFLPEDSLSQTTHANWQNEVIKYFSQVNQCIVSHFNMYTSFDQIIQKLEENGPMYVSGKFAPDPEHAYFLPELVRPFIKITESFFPMVESQGHALLLVGAFRNSTKPSEQLLFFLDPNFRLRERMPISVLSYDRFKKGLFSFQGTGIHEVYHLPIEQRLKFGGRFYKHPCFLQRPSLQTLEEAL